jgi:hypothetical protein
MRPGVVATALADVSRSPSHSRVPTRLYDGPERDCVEATDGVLSFRTIARLDQGEKSGQSSHAASASGDVVIPMAPPPESRPERIDECAQAASDEAAQIQTPQRLARPVCYFKGETALAGASPTLLRQRQTNRITTRSA